MRLLRSLAQANAGSSIAARIAMIAMTTNSSIKVNARPAGRLATVISVKLIPGSGFVMKHLIQKNMVARAPRTDNWEGTERISKLQ
jgi:hypothetical protein